jgi:hypothetical protein
MLSAVNLAKRRAMSHEQWADDHSSMEEGLKQAGLRLLNPSPFL